MVSRVNHKKIVLLGTAATTLGGVSAVIRSYERAGLFQRWPVVHVPTHRDGTGMEKLVLAVRAFMRYMSMLLRGEVLLVHVHSASNASFWRKSAFIIPTFIAGRPVIFHLHGGGFADFFWHRCGRVRRALVRFILDRSSEVVVLSETWKQRVSQMTRNPNLHVISSPVEAEELLRIDRTSRAAHLLLFMGRLDKGKGLYDLVDALAVLIRRHPHVRLCLAGEGDRDGIVRHAEARGVRTAIEFTGWVNGAPKIELWAGAAIYVLPSYIEGLPMSVLEAMAAGLPVVASNVGGIPDLVKQSVNGLLVSPGDVPALAAALDELLSDPSLATRFGETGRQLFLESFAPHRVVPQIEAAYRRWGASPRLIAKQAGA